MVCQIRPYLFKFFKGYLTQIVFGSFLNTLTQCAFLVILQIIVSFQEAATSTTQQIEISICYVVAVPSPSN